MRGRAVMFGLLACFVGCRFGDSSAEPLSLEKLRVTLAQREAKLGGFEAAFASTPVDPLEQQRAWRVAFRQPAALRVDAFSPDKAVHVYDGESYWVSRGEEPLRVNTVPDDAAERAGFLAETFRPFLPEGFRTPLFPTRGTRAKRIAHPKGPVAVAITTEIAQDSAAPLRVTTLLRWPSGDFLETRWEGSDGRVEVTMLQEHCSTQAICLPTLLAHSRDGTRTSETKAEQLQMGRPPESVFDSAATGANNSRR
ncbi:MAG: hypothetical protein ACKVPX_10220 [Myxococcaceae bacterium]